MVSENFEFLSADKRTKIHAVIWRPDDGRYSAVLQITHGMQEYVERYAEFAEFLTKKGFMVVGHDHLGHGASVASDREYGYFAQKNPSDTLILDMHALRTAVQKKCGRTPYFMLGHSMGSYLLRKYITLHAKRLSGAILVGTGSMPDAAMRLGMCLCRFLSKKHGWHYKSPLVKRLSFMGPYRKFDTSGAKIENNWLTRDLKTARNYYQDPKCRFDFTINGYFGLMETVLYDNQPKHMAKISKDLPLLFISGDQDPVGNMGKGVRKAYCQYKKAGISNVRMKLYKNDRHELLNELDRQNVYQDIYRWMKSMK